jgi:hypothetical protein
MSKPEPQQPGHPEQTAPDQGAQKRKLSPEAERALAEAAARRALADSNGQTKEVGGRGGLDPARYGDWEVGGIASDF